MLSSSGSVNDSKHGFVVVIQHVYHHYDSPASQFASISQRVIPCKGTKISSNEI